MKHNNCYIYPKTVREAIDGERHYLTGKESYQVLQLYYQLLKILKKLLAYKSGAIVLVRTTQRESWMSLQRVVLQCIKFLNVMLMSLVI